MYLEYLESKLDKMQKLLDHSPDSSELKRELQVLQSRQSALTREKISLIKSNEQLRNEVASLTQRTRQLHPENDARQTISKQNSNQQSPHNG